MLMLRADAEKQELKMSFSFLVEVCSGGDPKVTPIYLHMPVNNEAGRHAVMISIIVYEVNKA